MSADAALQLLPSGRLVLVGDGVPPKISKAFDESSAAGLLALATDGAEESFPPAIAYWREFAGEYLAHLCQSPPFDPARDGWEPVPAPSDDELADRAAKAPPAPGLEYLSADRLGDLWRELDAHVAAEVGESDETLEGWLRKRNPLWRLVGRVTFHLAENRRREDYPFAFLATYTHRVSSRGGLQYMPLGKALTEYAGKRNTRALRSVLAPVRQAAETDEFARELLDSRRIFHALAWRPREAHRFVRSIPAYERAGVIVKVPDWWRNRRPAQPKVQVTVETKGRTTVGLDSLLTFEANLALGGERISRREWEEALASGEPLVRLKGQWVEVDRERLESVLAQWEIAEAAAGDGVSFLEGMRLLAGLRGFGGAEGEIDAAFETGGSWTETTAGGRLRELLATMRDPSGAPDALPGRSLHATLRPYQEHGVNWLWLFYGLGLGGCLADDMGLGKTVQIIALLLRIKSDRKRSLPPSLLVVPASLVGNWRAEIERFAPSLDVLYAHPSQHTDPAILADFEPAIAGRDAVVTTYGMLSRLDALSDREWNLVVLDEAQAIKNAATAQTRRVKALRARRRFALTGTPIENSAADLWSLFDFLNPGLLGSAARFREAVKAAGELADGYARIRRLASPYILRRLKTDKTVVPDLPDKTEVKAACPLTKAQAALYQKSVRQLAADLDDPDLEGIARSGLVLSYLMRFKQICNHPALWSGSGDFSPGDSGKLKRLRAIAEEIASRGEKMLVFTQFREMTGPLADFLADVFGRSGLVLHGGTPVKRRQQLVEQFQSPADPSFFVVSLKAGGTGLNLTAASHVVHFDRWWNPAVEDQATDRAFRIGQKRNVLVHKFVCSGTIEERIDRMIDEKRELAGDILGSGPEKALSEMGNDELLRFVALDLEAAVF